MRESSADEDSLGRVLRHYLPSLEAGRAISFLIYSNIAYDVRLLGSAETFLRALEVKLRAKAARSIELLSQFGPDLPMPHARKLSGYPLYELRVKPGTNICRFFCFFDTDETAVLLTGYRKKSDHTDPRQIKRALRLRQEYLQGGEE